MGRCYLSAGGPGPKDKCPEPEFEGYQRKELQTARPGVAPGGSDTVEVVDSTIEGQPGTHGQGLPQTASVAGKTWADALRSAMVLATRSARNAPLIDMLSCGMVSLKAIFVSSVGFVCVKMWVPDISLLGLRCPRE